MQLQPPPGYQYLKDQFDRACPAIQIEEDGLLIKRTSVGMGLVQSKIPIRKNERRYYAIQFMYRSDESIHVGVTKKLEDLRSSNTSQDLYHMLRACGERRYKGVAVLGEKCTQDFGQNSVFEMQVNRQDGKLKFMVDQVDKGFQIENDEILKSDEDLYLTVWQSGNFSMRLLNPEVEVNPLQIVVEQRIDQEDHGMIAEAPKQLDKTDYTAMFEALSLSQNSNCKILFNSLMNLLQYENGDTDQIRLLLGTILIDVNKFKELSKKLEEQKEGNENKTVQGLFDIWMNSQLLNFSHNKNQFLKMNYDMLEDQIFRSIISTVMLKLNPKGSLLSSEPQATPSATPSGVIEPQEQLTQEVLNENIRTYLLQYPLSIHALSDPNMTSDLQMKSKVMEIHSKLQKLGQAEFEAITGSKENENDALCSKIAQEIINSIVEANKTRNSKLKEVDYQNKVKSFEQKLDFSNF